MSLALIRSAFFSSITSSNAAGIKISASSSKISGPEATKPLKPFTLPFSIMWFFNDDISIPFLSTTEPSRSITCVIIAPSSMDKK